MDDRAIERAMRRPRRYFYEDGIVEIVAGCVMLAIALLFLAEATMQVPPSFSAIGLIVVVFFGTRLGRRIVQAIKAKMTYPRTGRITYRQQPKRLHKVVALAFVAAIVGGAIALGFKRALPLVWIPLANGVVCAVFLLYLGQNLGLARFYMLAAASVLFGLAASLIGPDDIAGSALFFGSIGAALIISGILSLLRYLRQPSLPGT